MNDFDYVEVRLLGRSFLSDNSDLSMYLLEMARGSSPYKEEFIEKYPGVVEAAIEAIQDIERKRLRVKHLVYINGVMQAWCEPGFGDERTGLPHPPSKLCPNKHLFPTKL